MKYCDINKEAYYCVYMKSYELTDDVHNDPQERTSHYESIEDTEAELDKIKVTLGQKMVECGKNLDAQGFHRVQYETMNELVINGEKLEKDIIQLTNEKNVLVNRLKIMLNGNRDKISIFHKAA